MPSSRSSAATAGARWMSSTGPAQTMTTYATACCVTCSARSARGVEVVPRFQCPYGYNISLEDRAFVNANAFFMDDAPIRIGAEVRIGPGAQLVTALHPVDDPELRGEGWERALPIEVGANVWLGTSVTVCAGVTIGADSVIGAGSVVLSDIPDRVVAAGVPARVIREVG
ncbi:MAG: sugar O-acetyltransferase [Nocardioides sp.]|nr:sugar O-acetyltransferase [Nocardioides sp.]